MHYKPRFPDNYTVEMVLPRVVCLIALQFQQIIDVIILNLSECLSLVAFGAFVNVMYIKLDPSPCHKTHKLIPCFRGAKWLRVIDSP